MNWEEDEDPPEDPDKSDYVPGGCEILQEVQAHVLLHPIWWVLELQLHLV